MKTTILSVILLASAAFSRPQPGLPFLLIWPTAHSPVVFDVRTTDFMSALVAIVGGIRELKQGHVPWRE
jgi:hypothetical protein